MATIAELKLIVDSSQLKEAKTALEEFNASASKVDSSSKQISDGFKEASDSSAEFTRKQQQLIDKANQMVDTFGKGQSGVLSYKANLAGVGDVVDPLVKKFDALKNTQKESEAVNKEIVRSQQQADTARLKLIASLQEEIALFGKSKEEIQLYRAEQMGILDTVAPLVAELKKLKDAKAEADKAGKDGGKELSTQRNKLTLINEESKKHSFVIDQKKNLELINENLLKQEQMMASFRGKRERDLAEAELIKTRVEAARIIQEEQKKELANNKAIQDEFRKLRTTIDPVTGAYEKLYNQMDKIRELRKQVGKVSGVDAEELNKMEESVNRQIKQLDDLGKTSGKTAKEMAFAMRGLPAQFTDIVVSLQAGQRPMTILLQQGGQIKDMFGGIGPAFKAMGSYVLGLINPFTVLTAATIALGAAWYSGSKEAEAFQKTLITTGQQAKYSTQELTSMSIALSNHYTTVGRAAEVLNQVVASGNIHRDNLETVTRATLDWSSVTGTAVEDIVDDFNSLARDPVRALGELQEKYKYLTLETYEAARAQLEMGNKTEATRILTEQMASTMESRSKVMIASLGPVDSLLFSMKNNAKGVVDWFKQIGRGDVNLGVVDKIQEKYDNLADSIDKMEEHNKKGSWFTLPFSEEEIQSARDRLASLGDTLEDARKLMREDQERPFVEASIKLDERYNTTLTESVRLEREKALAIKEFNELRAKGVVTSEQEIKQAEILAEIESKLFKARKEESGERFQDSGKDYLELAKEELGTKTKIGAKQKEYIRRQQEVADLQEQVNAGAATQLEVQELAAKKEALRYYKEAAEIEKKWVAERELEKANKRNSVVRESAAERMLSSLREQEASLKEQLITDGKLGAEANKLAILRQKISDIEEKSKTSKLTKDQQSLLLAKDELITQQQSNVLLEDRLRIRATEEKLRSSKFSLDAELESYRNRNKDLSLYLSMSDKEVAKARERNELERDRARALAEVGEEYRKTGDKEWYDGQISQLNDFYDQRLELAAEYYAEEERLQNNWQDGLQAGLNNFIDNQASIYELTKGHTESILNDLNEGVKDSLVKTIMYGDSLKESFYQLSQVITEKVLGALVDIGVQIVINAGKEKAAAIALGSVKRAEIAATSAASTAATVTSTAEQTVAATTTATAWTPAAFMASIGSFGKAAAIGIAGVLAAKTLMKGFKTGGYTGNGGVNDVAGVVHGKEFVFDAESTARIGVGNLEKLRKGGSSQTGEHAVAGGGSVFNTEVVVNAEAGMSDSEARRQGELAAEGFEARVLSIMANQKRAGGMLSDA